MEARVEVEAKVFGLFRDIIPVAWRPRVTDVLGSRCPWSSAPQPTSPAAAVLQPLARRSLPPPLALPVLHRAQLRSF